MGCYNSKIINASADKVWSALRDFHDLSWAKGVIETLDVIGDKKGDQIGARRKLNGAFVETLQGLDELNKVVLYTIDQGPGPLEKCTGYQGRVRVAPLTDGDKTFVEWSSSWDDSEGGVAAFCDPIYQALLKALAAHFG
jgi:hypothetical protein